MSGDGVMTSPPWLPVERPGTRDGDPRTAGDRRVAHRRARRHPLLSSGRVAPGRASARRPAHAVASRPRSGV